MTDKCKCTMAQSLTGDGCRYCQPQEYIENLQTWLEEERAENEKLQAQVRMLEDIIKCGSKELDETFINTYAWLTQHDQQVRDEAYAAIGITKADEEQLGRIAQLLKGT